MSLVILQQGSKGSKVPRQSSEVLISRPAIGRPGETWFCSERPRGRGDKHRLRVVLGVWPSFSTPSLLIAKQGSGPRVLWGPGRHSHTMTWGEGVSGWESWPENLPPAAAPSSLLPLQQDFGRGPEQLSHLPGVVITVTTLSLSGGKVPSAQLC